MNFLDNFNPHTEKLKHEVIDLTIESGSSTAIDSINVREGEIIGILVDTDGTEKANNNLCSLAILDGGRQYHEEAVSLEFYKKPANGYSGIRPVSIPAGQKLYAQLTAIKNYTADVKVQVVFIVKQNK